METQEQLLTRFKKSYGNLRYSDIARKTGLQQTRVFRIFNGHEMKVSEYVIFKNILDVETEEFRKFNELIDESKSRLSSSQLNKISCCVQREIEISKIFAGERKTEVA